MERAEQGTLPSDGKARAHDRRGTRRPSRYVALRLRNRQQHTARIAVRPNRLGKLPAFSRPVPARQNRHHSNQAEAARIVQKPPRKIHREHAQERDVRRMERQRAAARLLNPRRTNCAA